MQRATTASCSVIFARFGMEKATTAQIADAAQKLAIRGKIVGQCRQRASKGPGVEIQRARKQMLLELGETNTVLRAVALAK